MLMITSAVEFQTNRLLPLQVSLLLPECSSAPTNLEAALNSFSSFYLIRNLPVHKLLEKDFLESAVYQGNTWPRSPCSW